MIKEATFVSVWDHGFILATRCKVDMETKEVFDIDFADVHGLEVCEREYVTIDGTDYPVSNDKESTEYWYS